MEAASATTELGRETLRAAELGFRQLLRRKRISESFREKYAEDIFGQAQKEYASWIAAGNVAANDVGWLINCAWRRTQDLLDELRRRPQAVSVEEAFYLADTSTPGPEEQAIDQDLHDRLQRAMACLPSQERKLLELVYFEGFDVFAAGRELGWAKSSSHRHHEAALKRLRAVLPDDLDALDVEIGLAAWVAITGQSGRSWSLPGGIEAIAHGAQNTAAAVTHRIGELWRRVWPAADPSNATVAGGAARAAGACGAAAVACLATGVIGPGVGGVDLISPTPDQPRATRPAKQARSTGTGATESIPQSKPTPATPKPSKRSSSPAKTSTTPADSAPPSTVPRTAAEQTRREFGVESTSGTPIRPSGGSGSSESSGSPSSGSGSSGGSRSHSSSATNAEFGL